MSNGYKLFGVPINNRVTIYFLLICLYYIVNVTTSSANSGMSGQLIAESNIYNQLMGGLIITYSLFFAVKGSTKGMRSAPLYKVSATMIAWMLLRHFVFYINDPSSSMREINSIFNTIYWFSAILFGIVNFRRIDKSSLNKLIILTVCVVSVFLMYRTITQKAILSEWGITAGINVAGSAYMLIPLVLYAFKGKFRLLMLLVCAFICVYSAKRQAVLGLGIILLFVSKDLIRLYFKQFRFYGILLIIAAVIWGNDYVNSAFEDLFTRQEEIEDTGGPVDSGRSELRAAAMEGYKEASFSSQFFGGGTGVSSKYVEIHTGTYNAPHCGFIQILCDYGIVGLAIFLFFFFNLLKWSTNFRRFSQDQLVYLSLVLVWINFNIVSHASNMFAVYLSMAYAYLYTYKLNYNFCVLGYSKDIIKI